MKKLLFIAFTGLILISCNKDQKAINSLDGRWKASSFIKKTFDETIDFLADGTGFEMTFDKCKQPKDISFEEEDVFDEVLEKGCTAKIVTIDSNGTNVTINGRYAVSEEGTFITFVTQEPDDNTSFFMITEISNSELKLTLNEDGVENIITLNK